MRGVYLTDCACYLIEKGCAVDHVVIQKFDKDTDACKALLKYMKAFHCGAPSSAIGQEFCAATPPCHWHAGNRYWHIHGPGGHIMTVIE